MDQNDLGADLDEVFLTADQIHAREQEIAAQVDKDYDNGWDSPILVVGVLKGAVMVVADLVRYIHTPLEMDWMAVSSYGNGTKSTGVVQILKDLDTDVTDRDVLIVEDIVDSGLTLQWLTQNLIHRGARSVRIAALLRKPEALKVDLQVDYVGFDIRDEFVIGYGLDYAQRYRNLPFVGTLASHVYGG